MRRARRLPALLMVLAVASCGGFLPFGGDDDDEPSPEAASVDAAADGAGDGKAADGAVVIDGSSLSDVVIERLPSGQCKAVLAACGATSECCTGFDCETRCCIPDDQPSAVAASCCSGENGPCAQTLCCLARQ